VCVQPGEKSREIEKDKSSDGATGVGCTSVEEQFGLRVVVR
jgi:hypothetical protein